jgi:hypothetical protein
MRHAKRLIIARLYSSQDERSVHSCSLGESSKSGIHEWKIRRHEKSSLLKRRRHPDPSGKEVDTSAA